MRREIPLIITAVAGFIFIIQFFVPHPPFNKTQDIFNDWVNIIIGFAIVLGVLNLMRVNLNKMSQKTKGWPYALVVILGLVVYTIVGLAFSGGRSFQNPGTSFYWVYINIFYPLNSTMFALLAFFVASASYRAFRARNKEATLLLIAATILMLGRVPLGEYLSGWLPEGYRLSSLSDWIMDFPQTAGQRAIMMGIALGIISTSLRIILGIERTYLGGD
jgi:hypothetical protein